MHQRQCEIVDCNLNHVFQFESGYSRIINVHYVNYDLLQFRVGLLLHRAIAIETIKSFDQN